MCIIQDSSLRGDAASIPRFGNLWLDGILPWIKSGLQKKKADGALPSTCTFKEPNAICKVPARAIAATGWRKVEEVQEQGCEGWGGDQTRGYIRLEEQNVAH